MSDPVFEEAKSALERLSADPAARELAREREIWEAKGRAEGEARGRAAGEAESVLAVLDARGVMLSSEERERILSCTDHAQLAVWIRRVVTVSDLLG